MIFAQIKKVVKKHDGDYIGPAASEWLAASPCAARLVNFNNMEMGYDQSCTWTATSASGATATVSETMITQPAMASTRTVTYVHTDTLGSPVAKPMQW